MSDWPQDELPASLTPEVQAKLDRIADKVLGYRPKEAKKKLRKKARKAKERRKP